MDTSSLCIKKDKLNRVWVAWGQQTGSRENIFIGRIKEGRIVGKKNLSQKFRGNNFSPTLEFTPDNHIWIAWVNCFRNKYHLIIKNPNADLIWAFNSSAFSTAFSPQLICDSNAQMWLFWVGQYNNLDAIFYSFLQGEMWTEPSTLTPHPSTPQFHPSTSRDSEGRICIAWSAYDDVDYEIYLSTWMEEGWTEPEQMTNNNDISDVEPCLSLYQNSIPLLSWTKADKGKRDIFLTYKEKEQWGKGINISRDDQRSGSSVLLSENNSLAIFWKDPKRAYLKTVSLFQLQPNGSSPPKKGEASTQPAAWLLDNRFIAFGDSITYGWENGPTPDNGYVPRLEALLDGLFTAPQIYNRGVPGEPTWEALSRIGNVITSDLAQYLLLMEGTNDVSIPSYSMSTTAFNLKEMIRKCFQYGVFPLISTIVPRAGHRWTESAKNRTFELNEKVEQLAMNLNIPLVDNFTVFYTYPGGHRELIASYPDNLHPNGTGYQVMAEAWYGKIQLIPFAPIRIQAVKKFRDNVVILNWDPDPRTTSHTHLVSYKIYRKEIEEKNFVHIGTVNASTTDFIDSNISLEKIYVYQLSALDSDSVEGPPSVAVRPERGDPFPPQNIQSETVVNKAFLYQEYINRITWEANSQNEGHFEIIAYRIYSKGRGEPDERFILIEEFEPSQLEYIERGFTTLDEAENRIYGLSSIDAEGNESPTGKESNE